MILPLVSELVARIARLAAIQQGCEKLRRKEAEVAFAGLTDSAKAILVSARFFANSVAPSFLSWTPISAPRNCWSHSAGSTAPSPEARRSRRTFSRHDVLPYENRSPHAEISEGRAVALWRLASGEVDLVIAPIQAALWRMRDAIFYRDSARVDRARRFHRARRSDRLPQSRRLRKARHLRNAGTIRRSRRHHRYFLARSAAARSSRTAWRHNRIHPRIRSEYAAFHQSRRTRRAFAAHRVFFAAPEVLEHQARRVSVRSRDEAAPRGFYPGWEFREFPLEHRPGIFSISPPSRSSSWTSLLCSNRDRKISRAHARCLRQSRKPASRAARSLHLQRRRMVARASTFPATRPSSIWRSRGGGIRNIRAANPAHHAASRQRARLHGRSSRRLGAGEHVLVSAASTGELERFADICHEYDLPYTVGELEENVTVTRLAQESSATNAPAMVLVKAPLAEGVVFPEAQIAFYGNADLFETPAAAPAFAS